MTELFLATANPDKVKEISEILGDAISLHRRPSHVPDVEETGVTLADNARLKALAVVRATGQPAVADDTGLEVDALKGAPGVYSARYAGETATYGDNIAKLLEALVGVPEPRTARFRTVAMAVYPDGHEIVVEGVVTGAISTRPEGSEGFGYDSVFVPDSGGGRTFAQMPSEEKHRLSHRGAAFRALRDRLQSNGVETGQ